MTTAQKRLRGRARRRPAPPARRAGPRSDAVRRRHGRAARDGRRRLGPLVRLESAPRRRRDRARARRFGLTPLFRGGGERLGQAGVVLLIAGLVCLAGWATSPRALAAVADTGGSVDVAEAIRDSTSISTVEAVWLAGLLLGLTLIAGALLPAGRCHAGRRC